MYAQVSDNYRAIDELRLRVLALLPLATGTGILVLLGGNGISANVAVPVGVFGMVVTVALYFYELHGVEKCAHFIHRGEELEAAMQMPGSFTSRPRHIFGVVSELLPSMVIYPASFTGWMFLALHEVGGTWLGVDVGISVTIAALVAGVAASAIAITVMQRTRPRRREALERRQA